MGSDAVVNMEERDFESEERLLREMDYYHGFIPREDLPFLLRKDGDYLLRVSEVDTTTTKIKRDIILSLMAEGGQESMMASVMTNPDDNPPNAKKTRLRNVVIRRVQQKYTVEAEKAFDSLKDLISYYKKNVGQISKMRFQLRNGVKLQRWELLHKDIRLGDLLGEGAFGEVRRGVLSRKGGENRDVAVKLMKGKADMCKEKIKEMMREARLMRDLRHKNIVRLYGVAVDEQPLYIILELVKGGSLNSYLEKKKGQVQPSEKLSMCLGAANGVDYLHKQKIIHRDLAARNCLYTDKKVVRLFFFLDPKMFFSVKISDFGLSRTGTEYVIKSKSKLPIKWLAPETITKFVFTDKTDVYSFGVMVHEIFADGAEPWETMNNADVKKAVIEGKMLPMKEVPEDVRKFCHERVLIKDSSARTDMKEVVKFFETVVQDGKPSSKGISDKTGPERSIYSTSSMSRLEGVGERKSSNCTRRKKSHLTRGLWVQRAEKEMIFPFQPSQ